LFPLANEVELKTKIADQDSQDPTKQSFEGWLCTLKPYLKTALLPDPSRERLMFCVEQMLLLYHAIDFLHLFGPKTALLYVKREQKEKLKLSGALDTQIGEWMQKLEGQAAKETRGNSPLLDRLIWWELVWRELSELSKSFSILNEQFLKNKDSRVLIFLKQRNQCELLSTLLNAQIQHRTDYFTGQASREEGGQNMRMQKAKLAEFSLGAIKVLCATTVAEEGIDISSA
jgi:ERCC4-related helicase